MDYQWNCSCPPDVEKLEQMCDDGRDITRAAFLKKVPVEKVHDLFPFYDTHWKQGGLTMASDWYIRYYSSKYDGKVCYYIVHSAIEYVFY